MRVSGLTFDAAAPIALAEFYERLLGWPIVRREGLSLPRRHSVAVRRQSAALAAGGWRLAAQTASTGRF